MDDFTPEQIQEKFDQLPPQYQEMLSSPEIHSKVRDIGSEEGLHIDQVGELVDQVGLVILGLAKASDFVADTTRRLEIDDAEARRIADKMNTEIFAVLRQKVVTPTAPLAATPVYISKPTTPAPLAKPYAQPPIQRPQPSINMIEKSISSLEQAGGFTIEKEAPETSRGSINIINSANPMVDKLMQRPTATPTEIVFVKEPPKPALVPPSPSQPPKNLPGIDPYREAIK